MTLKVEQLMLVLGGTILAIGLLLGFAPLSSNGNNCGTAFTGLSQDARVADLYGSMSGGRMDTSNTCDDRLSGRRAPALALTVPGVGLLVAGFIVRQRAAASVQ